MNDALGTRMKENYEKRASTMLTRRAPVIMRIDGKAFHTFTKGLERPFSDTLRDAMVSTAQDLVANIQGAKIAYVQSDEISILITDYDRFATSAWFDYKVQKMCSVGASMATAYFATHFTHEKGSLAMFDARVFNVPKEEVSNYFLWRFIDWRRNSVQLFANSYFSGKQMHGKNTMVLKKMCSELGYEWDDIELKWKNGEFVYRTGDVFDDVILPDDTAWIENIVNWGEK